MKALKYIHIHSVMTFIMIDTSSFRWIIISSFLFSSSYNKTTTLFKVVHGTNIATGWSGWRWIKSRWRMHLPNILAPYLLRIVQISASIRNQIFVCHFGSVLKCSRQHRNVLLDSLLFFFTLKKHVVKVVSQR